MTMNLTQSGRAFRPVNMYRVVFTVEDDEGLPLPGEAVELSLDAHGAGQCFWQCRVNGAWVSLDNDDYFRAQTDAIGQVVVEISADVSLWAPGVRLSHAWQRGPRAGEVEAQTIYPAAPIRDALAALDGNALRARTNKITQAPVIPAELQEHCDAIAGAVAYLFEATSHFSPVGTPRAARPARRGGRLRFEPGPAGLAVSWNPFEIFEEGVKFVSGAISTVPLSQIVESVASATIKPLEWVLDHVGDQVWVGVQYVIDGVQYGLQTVLGSEVDVFGAVKSIFESVAKLAGNIPVFGNLIQSFLEFFLDFPEINELRKKLRDIVKRQAGSLAEKVPDLLPTPEDWQDISRKLADIVAQIKLDPAFAKPLGEQSYRGKTLLPSLDPGRLAVIGGHDIWDALDWMPSQLADFGGPSLFPDPPRLDKLETLLRELTELLADKLVDIARSVQQSVLDPLPPEKLLERSILPIAVALEPGHLLTDLLDDGELFKKIGALSQESVRSIAELVEWLDRPCELPFFVDFFKYIPVSGFPGTKNLDLGPLSLLNIYCFGLAVVLHAARIELSETEAAGDPEVEKAFDVIGLFAYALLNLVSEQTSDDKISKAAGWWGDVSLLIPLSFTINATPTQNRELVAAWALDICATCVDFVGNLYSKNPATDKGKVVLMALLSTSSLGCYIAGYAKNEDRNIASLLKNVCISGTNIIRPIGAFMKQKPWQYIAAQAALGFGAGIVNIAEKYQSTPPSADNSALAGRRIRP
jgi:hypothetical protein